MLNAMTPPQGPHQQANSSAGGGSILLSQQQDSTAPTTPPENSSSPVSSSASSSSSMSSSTVAASTISSASSSLTSSQATKLPQVTKTSDSLRDEGCKDFGETEAASSRLQEAVRDQQQDDKTQDDQSWSVRGSVSQRACDRSPTRPDCRNASASGQDNSLMQQQSAPPSASSSTIAHHTSDNATGPAAAPPPTAQSPHHQLDATVSANTNTQYQQQQQQQQQQHHPHSGTNNHYKSGGHFYSSNNSGRFNNNNSGHSHHNRHYAQHNGSNGNSCNQINPSTITNSATFSSIRSNNQRGHTSNRRHKNNNHHHNQHQQNYNHHHNHQQHHQSTMMSNGVGRDGQQHLSAPHNSALASTSPATSLSGSDIASRNTSTAIGRRSTAQTPAGPPHYVEMHVYAGECVAFQLMDGQEQVITGPATMTMVSQQESPPVPIPVQVPPGHMIHQVADENGTLKHIIFSVMNCEDNTHVDSNVINFPHETFRVDSLGELVSTSTSASSIGVDCVVSGDQQATSPSSKSASVSSEKINPSIHYNTASQHRPDTAETNLANYKYPKESYKSSINHKQAADHRSSQLRDKGLELEISGQQALPVEGGKTSEATYELAGHDMAAPSMIQVNNSSVGAEMDPSLMANSEQMMGLVGEQMYGYPTCACCCCYCDPNAEAAAAAAAAAAATGHPPTSMSTGHLVGQQDGMMMPTMQSHHAPSLQLEVPQAGGIRFGRDMTAGVAMGYQSQQENPMLTNTGQHQPHSFHNQSQFVASHMRESANNVNGGKAHANKSSRGPQSYKQNGNSKPHQNTYDRHHNNYKHYSNQSAYSDAQNYQPEVPMGYKSLQLHQAGGTQDYHQPIFPNYDSHPASYASPANAPAASTNKTSISQAQPAVNQAPYKGNHGMYNVAANRSYRNDHQQLPTDLGEQTTETTPAKRHHYQAGDKNVMGRYNSNSRVHINNHVSSLNGPSSSQSVSGNQSTSSGSVSPMRPSRANKGHNQRHNQSNHQQSSNESRGAPTSHNANQEQVTPKAVQASRQKESSSGKILKADSTSAPLVAAVKNQLVESRPAPAVRESLNVDSSSSASSAADQEGQVARTKQQPIVSNDNIPVTKNEDVSKDSGADTKSQPLADNAKSVTVTPSQEARQQSEAPLRRPPSPNVSPKNESTIDDTPTIDSSESDMAQKQLSTSSATEPIGQPQLEQQQQPQHQEQQQPQQQKEQQQQQEQQQPQTQQQTHQHQQQHLQQNSKKHIEVVKRVQEPAAQSPPDMSRNSRAKQKKSQKVESNKHKHQQQHQLDSMTRNNDTIIRRRTSKESSEKQKSNNNQQIVGESGSQIGSQATGNSMGRCNTAPSHQTSGHSSKHNHSHNQPIKVMSILKQCRNKFATSVGRAVQNSLSSYSDTKFAGLLLTIFTMFATLLAIIIDYYIDAPVTE